MPENVPLSDRRGLPEPPAFVMLRWCPVCGRNDRVNRLPDNHYARGEKCPGIPNGRLYLAASDERQADAE